MTWKLFEWNWRLEGPLTIGMPPSGALNRSRPYVPARVLWGAATAEISRLKSIENFPDYGKYGKDINTFIRFTYLFPAKHEDGEVLPWTPTFKIDKENKNLRWRLQKTGEAVSDREFRQCLMHTRPSTAIDPKTDAATEGTLRETECINQWWNDDKKNESLKPVLLTGYIFVKEDQFLNDFKNLKTLFIGGDTRYGLGKITRLGELRKSGTIFEKCVQLGGDEPSIKSDIVLGHTFVKNVDNKLEIRGMKELFGAWDQGRLTIKGNQFWAPGSFLEKCTKEDKSESSEEITANFKIKEFGYWDLSDSNS